MGNSTVKSHQATEVRLKSRRKVIRPLRPIPSRAIEAGSGTPGGVTPPVEVNPWLMMDMPAPGLTLMSLYTQDRAFPRALPRS